MSKFCSLSSVIKGQFYKVQFLILQSFISENDARQWLHKSSLPIYFFPLKSLWKQPFAAAPSSIRPGKNSLCLESFFPSIFWSYFFAQFSLLGITGAAKHVAFWYDCSLSTAKFLCVVWSSKISEQSCNHFFFVAAQQNSNFSLNEMHQHSLPFLAILDWNGPFSISYHNKSIGELRQSTFWPHVSFEWTKLLLQLN